MPAPPRLSRRVTAAPGGVFGAERPAGFGPADPQPGELAAGATGTLTATLLPTVAAGTAVNGTLSVIDSTDLTDTEPDIGFPTSFSDFQDFPYAYTVGS